MAERTDTPTRNQRDPRDLSKVASAAAVAGIASSQCTRLTIFNAGAHRNRRPLINLTLKGHQFLQVSHDQNGSQILFATITDPDLVVPTSIVFEGSSVAY